MAVHASSFGFDGEPNAGLLTAGTPSDNSASVAAAAAAPQRFRLNVDLAGTPWGDGARAMPPRDFLVEYFGEQ